MQLELLNRSPKQLLSGCHHVPSWLTINEQQELINDLREWCAGGFWTPKMPNGTPMNHPLCGLGLNWQPYEYLPTDRPFPGRLMFLAKRAIAATLPHWQTEFWPDVGIVNYFPPSSSLGLHQDRSEAENLRDAGSPVVTISLGDAALFRLGQRAHRDPPYSDVELRSGDLIVMGDYSRLCFHGIPKIFGGTAPAALEMKPGRLSVTIRQANVLEVKA
jgi:alkylated DNA repair protein (DNA oxidative demethylase)